MPDNQLREPQTDPSVIVQPGLSLRDSFAKCFEQAARGRVVWASRAPDGTMTLYHRRKTQEELAQEKRQQIHDRIMKGLRWTAFILVVFLIARFFGWNVKQALGIVIESVLSLISILICWNHGISR